MVRTQVVKQYERGLDYRRGRFVGMLEAGLYRLWPFTWREIVKVDVREQTLQITGQEVLTADSISVRLNILVRFRVTGPEKAVHAVDSYLDALHQAAQLAARDVVAGRTLEDLLAQRTGLTETLTSVTGERAAAFGLEVVTVALKDVGLRTELRAAYEARAAADQQGQAALIAARHQVAVARARANAARVLAETPGVMAHRQLEVLEKAAENYGNHFVVLPEALGGLVARISGSATEPGE